MEIEERIKQIAEKYQEFRPDDYNIGRLPVGNRDLARTILCKFVDEMYDLLGLEAYDFVYHEEYAVDFAGMSLTAENRLDAYFVISWLQGDTDLRTCPVKLTSAPV